MKHMLYKLIRFLFLVKEITSKYGKIHFRRYRLLQTPWFAIYVHQICRSDEDLEMHDHPWNYSSILLEGSYIESCRKHPDFKLDIKQYYSGDVIEHDARDVHKLTLVSKEVWSLVFTSGRSRVWGYRYSDGTWIDHIAYRNLKNKQNLNERL